MSKATRKSVTAALEAIGATLDEDDTTLTLDAPDGHVWSANQGHSYAVSCGTTRGGSWMPEAWAEAAETIAMGVEKCTDADCDYCDGDALAGDESGLWGDN